MAIQTRHQSNDEAFDSWSKRLVTEAINQREASWAVGDLMLEGLDRFEEARVWTVAEATGMTPEAITNYKSLAKTFPKGKRRYNLGISVHEAVRSLDEPVREAFLDLVEKYEISRTALRERVKAYKGGDFGALEFKWKPAPKVVDVPDNAVREDQEDTSVFDNGAFGAGLAAEKQERERPEYEALSENDALRQACRAIERLDVGMIDKARVSAPSLKDAITKLNDIYQAAVDAQSSRIFPARLGTTKGGEDEEAHSASQCFKESLIGRRRQTEAFKNASPENAVGDKEPRHDKPGETGTEIQIPAQKDALYQSSAAAPSVSSPDDGAGADVAPHHPPAIPQAEECASSSGEPWPVDEKGEPEPPRYLVERLKREKAEKEGAHG